MANPETNFWHQVKKNLPKYRWIRIESWATQGVPVELKVSRSKQIRVSPHQIAYHVERKDCPCFILVRCALSKDTKKSEVLLYEGEKIREVSEQGTRIKPLVALSYPYDWSMIEKVFDNA